MAEAAAAFYAIETVVEGAAVGAFAVSRSTTPLHLRFRKLATPVSSSSWVVSTGHSLNVVKGKAYIFGGDNDNGTPDSIMKIVTLPSDTENGEPDYQLLHPELESSRPLQQYTSPKTSEPGGFEDASLSTGTKDQIRPRTHHVATSIDSNIYILAGRHPTPTRPETGQESSEESQLLNCDQIYCFSTQSNKWSFIHADIEKCRDGIPPARINASCTSTSHPQPESAIDVTVQSHGTIILHGGYDAQNQQLRDTWAFDISSRVWTRWPDLPSTSPEEIAGEGRIVCVNNRVWRVGDGFGKMVFIDFDILEGGVVSGTSGPHPGETGIQPSGDKWEVLSFGDKASNTALQGEIGGGSEKPLVDKAESLPVPRQGAGFFPVRIGAGRLFLLYFMGTDGPRSVLGDVWSFQIKADEKTPAAVKDVIRNAVGKDTGENQWAPCEIIESTKDEGQIFPPQGLAAFAADSWKDLGGGNIVLWGGVDASGRKVPQCWVMSVE